AFPIVGARYRCLDCPERVGFDLCAACYSCPPPVVGRFNQRHVSAHRMVEVRQRDGMLHRIFESVHPELMARLMASIEEEGRDHEWERNGYFPATHSCFDS
ncbi:unnamed protein product, partial [Closterium sp. Naga37s-1]